MSTELEALKTQMFSIRKSFVQENMKSSPVFDPSVSSTDEFHVFLAKCLNDFSATAPFVASSDFATTPLLYKLNNTNGTWTQHTDGFLTMENKDIRLNMSKCFASIDNDNLKHLEKLQILYDLLKKEKYEAFRALKSDTETMTFQSYRLDTSGTPKNSEVTKTKTDIVKMLGLLFNLDTPTKYIQLTHETDVVLVRRVLRMYMLLAHMQIATAMRYAKSDSTESVNIANSVYDEIVIANNLMYQDIRENIQESIGDISVALNNQVNNYRNFSVQLDKIDQQIRTLSGTLKKDIKVLENRKQSYTALQRITYISYVVFAIFVTGMVLAFTSSDVGMRMMYGLYTLIFGVIAAIILYILSVHLYTVEAFSTSYLVRNLEGAKVSETSVDLSKRCELIMKVTLDALTTYLSNSVRIAMMLTSYKIYVDFNGTLSKEHYKYANIRGDMSQKMMLVGGKKELIGLESRRLTANVLLVISLMLILGVSTYLVQTMPSLTNLVMSIASVLIILIFITYVIYTNTRVRTSAKSVYWPVPTYV